jgi:hypothetical protein
VPVQGVSAFVLMHFSLFQSYLLLVTTFFWGCAMETHLYFHLWNTYQLVRKVLYDYFNEYTTYHNPLVARLVVVLQEQENGLYEALILLQKGSFDKKQFRYFIEVAYLNEEVRDPFFRGWVRSVIWMGTVSKENIKEKKAVMKRIRYELVQSVPYIQQIYGEQKTKFIIPPLIRSKYDVTGGM